MDGVVKRLSKCSYYLETISQLRTYQEKLMRVASEEEPEKKLEREACSSISCMSGFMMRSFRRRSSSIAGNKTSGNVEMNEGIVEEVEDKQVDKFDFRKYDDFKVLCKEFMEYLMKLNENLGRKCFDIELILPIKQIISENDILVGFYGTGNTGKSTLLNSILKDKLLPAACQSETGVSVWIEFNNISVGKNELELPIENGGIEVIRGAKNIYKKLRHLNKRAREGDRSIKKCCLKTRNKFGNNASSRKFILLDIPGNDEYGALEVAQNCQMSQVLTSAFIFVTSMSSYTLDSSNHHLLQLLEKHNELIQQNRLFIVVTHLDDYQRECEEEEEEYDEEKLMKRIAEHYNNNIFHFPDTEILKDKIILVCGTWALAGRLFKKYGNNEFNDDISSLKTNLSKFRECPVDEFTDLLLSESNIEKLEQRLIQIGEGSEIIQKQKIATEMKTLQGSILKKLCKSKTDKQAIIEEMFEKIEINYVFIEKIHNFYGKTITDYGKGNNILFLKEMSIWRKLRTAYQEDMKEKSVVANLLCILNQKFDSFEENCQEKIKGKYTPIMFDQDMKELVENVFQYLHGEMSKWSNYKKLSNAYTEECSKVYAIAQECGNIESAESSQTEFTEAPPLIPEFTTSVLNASIEIPYGELNVFQILWRFLKWKITGIKSPSSYDSKVSFPKPQKSGEDTRREESEHAGKNATYKEWTAELDEQTKCIKQKLHEYVTKFYEDCDQNIVQICCKQYFQASIQVLQMYDTSMSTKIEEYCGNLEAHVESTKMELHKMIGILKLHTPLKEMSDEFTLVCENI